MKPQLALFLIFTSCIQFPKPIVIAPNQTINVGSQCQNTCPKVFKISKPEVDMIRHRREDLAKLNKETKVDRK